MFSFACSRIFCRSYLRKPGCSTVRLYSPTGSSEKTNPPLASVVEARERPVEVLLMVTLAAPTTSALRVAYGAEERCCVTNLRQRDYYTETEQARSYPIFVFPSPKHALFLPVSKGLSRILMG